MRLLLCPPDFYGIEYEINPWMSRSRKSDSALARAQWQGLRSTLESLGAKIELVSPVKGLPDMVFTANAGLVAGKRVFLARFRHKERQGEEPHFEEWFAKHGFTVERLPEKKFFEGEGDALFCGETLFCGYRLRSDVRSHEFLSEQLGVLTVSLELVNDYFYHLDTCFCPLPDGRAFYFPEAFDEYGQRAIREHVTDAIVVAAEEAKHFACNAVVLGRDVVLPEGCPKLYGALERWGYKTHPLPMTEFIKAGGACKCLVLYLG
jgi:N-dimethylarginine dimethylaminohydrolase